MLSFALPRPGDLVGSLLNADGSVPQDAQITASRTDGNDAQFESSVDPTTGAFDISAAPGAYVLDYYSGPFHLYAPGVATRGAAQTYSVTASQTATLPGLVVPTPISVSGTVTAGATTVVTAHLP